MWNKLDGFEKKKLEGKLLGYFIDGQRVSETAFKRKYVRALERELDAACWGISSTGSGSAKQHSNGSMCAHLSASWTRRTRSSRRSTN